MKSKIIFAVSLSIFVASAVSAAPPAWVDGKDARFSPKVYVIGVGTGPTREAADNDARAEVARVFESKVTAVMKDFQKAASTVNSSGKGVNVEVQEVSKFTQVATNKTLTGLEIKTRAKDGKTHYSLALLKRDHCVSSLTSEINTLDGQISAAVSRAGSGDKLKAFKSYGNALNLMDDREGKNAMLRVCAGTGRGITAPISLGELTAKFDEVSGNFKLGVILEGRGAERVRDCIMEKMSDKGYEITEISIRDDADGESKAGAKDPADLSNYDAVLKGKLRSEKAGKVAGSILVRTSLTVKLVNTKTNKVLKTYRGSRKEGRPTVEGAVALAAHKICKKHVKKIVAGIDKYFKR